MRVSSARRCSAHKGNFIGNDGSKSLGGLLLFLLCGIAGGVVCAAFGCSRVGIVAGRPLSRVESGGKPPGESQMRVAFPRTPSRSVAVGIAAAQGGGSGCRGLLEFPLAAEATLCKVAAFVLGGLSGSRQRLGVCERRGMRDCCVRCVCLRSGRGCVVLHACKGGLCVFPFGCSRVGIVAGRPLSRVESGGKPPGESQMRVAFPRTPSRSVAVGFAAAIGGGSGCRGLPEFPLAAEATLCKVAAFVPGGLSGGRQRLGVCERRGCGIVASGV